MRVAGDEVSNTWTEVDPVGAEPASGPPLLVGICIGGAFAGFLVWRGHSTAALGLIAVVTLLTLARRLSPWFERAFSRVLARVAQVVGIGLSWFALGLTMLFVIFPLWAISRLFRWDVLEPEPRHGRWSDRRLPPWRQRPDRSFADDRRALPRRTRWHGFLTAAVPLVLFAAMAVAFRQPLLAFAGRVTPGHLVFGDEEPAVLPPTGTAPAATVLEGDGIADPSGDPPDGYPRDPTLTVRDQPWASEYFDEYFPFVFGFDPYLTVRAADRTEQYVNVEDRVRRSYVAEGAESDPAALDVWFFGGSALFGQGQRDDHTLPSEIARLAEEDGIPLRVQNFGVPSYLAWQDSLLLAQMLSERPAPDLIVTYEGFNDIANTLPAGSPTQVTTAFSAEVRYLLLEAGADFSGADNSAIDTMPRTDVRSPNNAATIFGRASGLAQDLAAANEVPIEQYLQPSLWTRDLAVDDATLANIGADRAYHDTVAPGWEQARALMAVDGVVDLGDSLDDLDELVYSDDVHMNERATRAVAEAMYADLGPALERLHQSASSNAGP